MKSYYIEVEDWEGILLADFSPENGGGLYGVVIKGYRRLRTCGQIIDIMSTSKNTDS